MSAADKRAAEIKARVEATTEGPLILSREDDGDAPIDWHIRQDQSPGVLIASLYEEESPRAYHDAAFFAAAPADVRWLLAERELARSMLHTIAVELDHAGAPTGPADGRGVYAADGRVIAMGLELTALRAERERLAGERDAWKEFARCLALKHWSAGGDPGFAAHALAAPGARPRYQLTAAGRMRAEEIQRERAAKRAERRAA